jgi:TonB family protein
MHKLYITIVAIAMLLGSTTHIFAQVTTTYRNNMYEPVKKVSDATYVVTTEKRDGKYFSRLVEISSQQLIGEGFFANKKATVEDGIVRYFHKNGNIKEEANYSKGVKGITKLFHEDGSPESERLFDSKNGRMLFLQVWDTHGEPVLTKGNGLARCRNIEENIKTYNADEILYLEVKDSVMVLSYFSINSGQDTVYVETGTIPDYKGGMENFAKFLQKNLRYPHDARSAGQQGRVFISFMIDEKGRVDYVNVFKGVSESLDKEAKRVVALTDGNWLPNVYNNKPVKRVFVIPIVYKIG